MVVGRRRLGSHGRGPHLSGTAEAM